MAHPRASAAMLLLALLLAQACSGFLLIAGGASSPSLSSPAGAASPLRRPLPYPAASPLTPRRHHPLQQQLPPLAMAMTARGLRGGGAAAAAPKSVQPQQQRRTQGQRAAAVKAAVKGAAVLALAGAVVAGGWWRPAAAWAAKQGTTAAGAGSGEHLHIGQRIANAIRSKTGWPDWLILMVISALPVVELRGGVPVGLWMGLPPAQTFALACVGNFVPVPFILLALNNVPWLMEKVTPTLERKLKDATGTKMNWQALAIFVGVPLPGTGAWTGAALAALFKLSYAESFLGVVAGILSAGAIMTAVVLAGMWGGVAVGLVLLASLVLQQLGKRRGGGKSA